jgi:hypothetical protein
LGAEALADKNTVIVSVWPALAEKFAEKLVEVLFVEV